MEHIAKEDFLELFYTASIGQDKSFIKMVEQVLDDTPTIDIIQCKDCESANRLNYDREELYYCKFLNKCTLPSHTCIKIIKE